MTLSLESVLVEWVCHNVDNIHQQIQIVPLIKLIGYTLFFIQILFQKITCKIFSMTSRPISKMFGSSCLMAQIMQLNMVLNWSLGQENKTNQIIYEQKHGWSLLSKIQRNSGGDRENCWNLGWSWAKCFRIEIGKSSSFILSDLHYIFQWWSRKEWSFRNLLSFRRHFCTHPVTSCIYPYIWKRGLGLNSRSSLRATLKLKKAVSVPIICFLICLILFTIKKLRTLKPWAAHSWLMCIW